MADAGGPHDGRMAATPGAGPEVAGQRTNVGPRRAVDVDVDVDKAAGGAPGGRHLEPVDAHRAGLELDGLALADQLIRAATTDLDRADRRRHLLDIPAQPGDCGGDLL